MLEDMGGSGAIMEKRAERCKTDYEAMIKRVTEKLEKTLNFQNALFDYVGSSRVRNKLAELLGELVSEARILQGSIDELIKQQEKDSRE